MDSTEERLIHCIHTLSDMERKYTALYRMAKRHEALLTDGLHALEDGRTPITHEFIERVLDDLRTTIQKGP